MSVHDVSEVPAELISAIRAAERPVVLGHVTPDADCIGSIGALGLGLQRHGRTPLLCVPGALARSLEYLVGVGELTLQSPADLNGCDLAIVLDTAKDKRVNAGEVARALGDLPIVNIDHHATNQGFGRYNWVDANRSSTCEMVFELLTALDVPITPPIATLLYSGIFSDTMGFSLSNTTPRSLDVAHHLALAGARIPELCERLHRSQSRAEFALLKVIYANTRVSDDGRIAWSTATHDEIVAADCDASTIDDQVEVPRSIEGISIAILFTEGEAGVVRMNFRGESGLSILPLAEHFGGGGHHAAAGARRRGRFDFIVEEVVRAAQQYLP